MLFRGLIAALLLFPVLLVGSDAAHAAYGNTSLTTIDPAVIAIDEGEFLGAKVSGDYLLVDSEAQEFTLGELRGKPVILLLSYYDCDGACPTANARIAGLLSGIRPSRIGSDYSVVTVSFDSNDDAASLAMFVKEFEARAGKVPQNWRMALMKDGADIERLTASVGYKFFWSARDGVFLHPSVLIVLSPKGRVTRFLYGARIESKDIEVALSEAAFGIPGRSVIADLTDLLVIACYSYNFKEGRYTLNYPVFIAAGSLLLGVSSVFVSILVFKRKSRR
jgi:protein SCO1/2